MYIIPVVHDEVLNNLELLFVKELLLGALVCLVLHRDILALVVAELTVKNFNTRPNPIVYNSQPNISVSLKQLWAFQMI